MPSIFKRAPSTQQPQRPSTAIFSDQALNVLGPNVCKALAEKQMETKRKGAKEIEELIRFYQEKELSVAREQTTSMLNILLAEFLESQNRDIQIGGLIGVLGAARGLQENLKYYLGQIMVPVMKKFSETTETTLRYYAAECIYNLCILAPAGVKCLLDELLGLVFALWKDTDTRLARPATFTDALVRELTAKYATQQQVLSLLSLVTAEASNKPVVAPTYLIPWLDLLTDKARDSPKDVNLLDILMAITHIASFPVSDEEVDRLETLIERFVAFMKQQTDSQSLDVLEALNQKSGDIIREGKGCSLSLLTSFVSAICGLSVSRRRIQVPANAKLDLDEETREFVAKVAPSLLPLVLSLLSRPGLNSEYLKIISARIQESVSRSPTRNLLVASLSKVLTDLLTAGKRENNFQMIEAVLQWLIFLSRTSPQLELPSECITIISSLISSDRSSIRQLAVNCVVELVQDESCLQSILNGTVRYLGELETEVQTSASLGIIEELLAKHDVDAINNALSAMPRSTTEEVYRYIIACYLCAYAIYSSPLYLRLSRDDGWAHTPGTALLIAVLRGEAPVSLELDPTAPGTYMISQIEAILLLSGLPNSWQARMSSIVYQAARLLLPVSSPAYVESSRWAPAEGIEYIIKITPKSWKLPNDLNAFSLWDDTYGPRLRRILYPLTKRAMAVWAPEGERPVEKEASPRVAAPLAPSQVTHQVHSSPGHPSGAPQGLLSSERPTDKNWSTPHEEEVICQETPTRMDSVVATQNAPGFASSSPTKNIDNSEVRGDVLDGKRSGESAPESTVIDQSINDTPNQSTILSDISTEPNSPTASQAFHNYYGGSLKGRVH